MGPVKNVAKLPAKEFSVYFEISNVKSSLLHKKKIEISQEKHLDRLWCLRSRQAELKLARHQTDEFFRHFVYSDRCSVLVDNEEEIITG
jgi:hypothetical protein